MVKFKEGLSRKLILWFGSFVIVGSTITIFFNAPVIPVLLAGFITLAIILWRNRI